MAASSLIRPLRGHLPRRGRLWVRADSPDCRRFNRKLIWFKILREISRRFNVILDAHLTFSFYIYIR